MALPATVGDPVPIVLILEDGVETRYPQAEVYEPGGVAPIQTIDLPHKAKGRYEGSFTPSAANIYTLHFFIYADAGHTVEDITYTRSVDQIVATESNVDDLAAGIVRILGLVHENVFIDKTIHDANGQLLEARVRVFDSAANVPTVPEGAETVGLIATYQMRTVYEGVGLMGHYKMEKV
jgi:hypothetical protein